MNMDRAAGCDPVTVADKMVNAQPQYLTESAVLAGQIRQFSVYLSLTMGASLLIAVQDFPETVGR